MDVIYCCKFSALKVFQRLIVTQDCTYRIPLSVALRNMGELEEQEVTANVNTELYHLSLI